MDGRNPVSSAWHYTTAAGLIGMITRHRMWATSAAYMNDREEIQAGRQALREAVETHEPALEEWQLQQLGALGVPGRANAHDVFLLCASLDGDSLTLWRTYGGGSEAEYAIDLDPNVALLPVQQNNAEEHPAPAPPGWGDDAIETTDEGVAFRAYDPDEAYAFSGEWGEVEYLTSTNGAARRELRRILGLMRKPKAGEFGFPFYWAYMAGPDPTVLFKHPGFSDEREVRATWIVGPWWRFVLYRAGRFGVTPYIEVAAGSTRQTGEDARKDSFLLSSEAGLLPIRSVRIGPTRAGDDAVKTLRAILDVNGYGHVAIERSATPYR